MLFTHHVEYGVLPGHRALEQFHTAGKEPVCRAEALPFGKDPLVLGIGNSTGCGGKTRTLLFRELREYGGEFFLHFMYLRSPALKIGDTFYLAHCSP